MTIKNLEKVLYFEQFIVVEPGLTDLKKGEIISEEQYIDYQDEYGEDSFSASIGAEAIEQMLISIDLEADYNQLKIDLTETKSELKKTSICYVTNRNQIWQYYKFSINLLVKLISQGFTNFSFRCCFKVPLLAR